MHTFKHIPYENKDLTDGIPHDVYRNDALCPKYTQKPYKENR